MNEFFWKTQLPYLLQEKTALPKYRVLANAVAAVIESGQLAPDEQLPTVRDLAEQLSVSGTTVAAAYRILAEQRLVAGMVGSGTRVSGTVQPHQQNVLPPSDTFAPSDASDAYSAKVSLWRRRTQTNHIATLSRAFPGAKNFASGTPNPAFLPHIVLRRAWSKAAAEVTARDLQYTGSAPLPMLKDALLPRLERDLIPAVAADLLIGSSAQQLMMLALQITGVLNQNLKFLVGVEEPGYPTLFDSCERMGHQLIGIEVDAQGAVPGSVEAALNRGVRAIVFTPRAHNPTGASWSPQRLAELTEVIAPHPKLLIIEDDQFAEAANTPVGSLLGDPRLENQVIYIRSFSKVIAPDLRLALAIARPHLRALLTEAKFYTDGWSSSFSQRTLAHALTDPGIDVVIREAREAYNRRRTDFIHALATPGTPAALRPAPAADGINVWLELQNGVSASAVAERAAAAGVIVATGEPFFVRVGRDDALRINIGMFAENEVTAVSQTLIAAIEEAMSSAPILFSEHSL